MHSLTLPPFIERSGLRPQGLGAIDNWFSWRVAELAPYFPVLFFVWVLAGESSSMMTTGNSSPAAVNCTRWWRA